MPRPKPRPDSPEGPPSAFGPPVPRPAAPSGTGVSAGAGLGMFGTKPEGSQFGTFMGDLFRLGGGVTQKLGGAAGPALDTGLGTLQAILASQGRTDPALFNRDLAQLAFGNQSAQRNVAGSLAASGLGGSIGGQALQAAVGQAGQERLSQRRAEETNLAEARKRQDLGLLMELIINPALTAQATRLGVSKGNNSGNAAGIGALGSLLGGIGGLLGGIKGP